MGMSEAPRFRPPPGWPSPPPGWTPAPGWQPPTDWPPAPPGWHFWEPAESTHESMIRLDETSIHAVTPQAPPRDPRYLRYQRAWLATFWAAAALNVLFVVLAVGGTGVPPAAVLAVISGAIAVITGSFIATAAYRIGIDDAEFDDVAKGPRIAVFAWLILGGAVVGGALVGSDFGTSPLDPRFVEVIVQFSEGVTAQLFGLAILFVVVGDGYTAYRRLRTKPRTSVG